MSGNEAEARCETREFISNLVQNAIHNYIQALGSEHEQPGIFKENTKLKYLESTDKNQGSRHTN